MDNNLREKAEALVKLIEGGEYRSYKGALIDYMPEYKDLKASLRPSREEIADYLAEYDKWRKGGDGPQPEPKELGEYIQYAIKELRKKD